MHPQAPEQLFVAGRTYAFCSWVRLAPGQTTPVWHFMDCLDPSWGYVSPNAYSAYWGDSMLWVTPEWSRLCVRDIVVAADVNARSGRGRCQARQPASSQAIPCSMMHWGASHGVQHNAMGKAICQPEVPYLAMPCVYAQG